MATKEQKEALFWVLTHPKEVEKMLEEDRLDVLNNPKRQAELVELKRQVEESITKRGK